MLSFVGNSMSFSFAIQLDNQYSLIFVVIFQFQGLLFPTGWQAISCTLGSAGDGRWFDLVTKHPLVVLQTFHRNAFSELISIYFAYPHSAIGQCCLTNIITNYYYIQLAWDQMTINRWIKISISSQKHFLDSPPLSPLYHQ